MADDKEAKSAEGETATTPEAEAAAAEEAAKKKAKKKKLIIIGAAAAVLLLGGGGGAAFMMMGHKKDDAKAEHAAGGKEGEAKAEAKIVYFDLGDLLVNLSGTGKKVNFLKVKISIELADEKDLPIMNSIKPRIVDNFQVYLRELRMEDLRGSAGLYRLREELLMRVTEAAQPVRIRDVLFQEMLVQ